MATSTLPNLLGGNWHKSKREKLCYGYARMSDVFIPSQVIKLIFEWYDDANYWKLDDETTDKFWSSGFKVCIYGPKFNIHGVTFQLTVSPKGWNYPDYGVVYLEIASFPSNIKSAAVSYLLFCEEINHEFIRSKLWTPSTTTPQQF